MDKQSWKQIQSIFKHLADKSPSHRNDYLDMVCEEDVGLRVEVQALLDSHDKVAQQQTTVWSGSIQDVASSLQRPRQVGDYEIVEEIGRGGMGVVYLAQHTEHGRVALKLLPRYIVASGSAQLRYQQEAQILDELQHQNLCHFYETFTTEDYAAISMEYIDGVGLDQRLKKGPMAYAQSIKLLLQLAEVLALAHSHNLVHRDIKPSNILFVNSDAIKSETTNDGVVKLIDFGIAKFADNKLTATGQVLGTPAYMSPEQWRGGTVDYRTDLWSCGVLLFKLLTGVSPFAANDRFEVASRVLTKQPAELPLTSCDGKSLNEIQGIIERLLQKQVEQRLQSCDELAHQLKHLLEA